VTNEKNIQRVLWGIGSPRTMRPHWALHELSLPYDLRAIRTRSADTQTAEFTTLNSRQKIPVLQDGEFVITESAAIVAYLSDRYANADNALVPSSQSERARWLEWCFFIMTELDASSLYVIRRHLGLKDIYGDAPAAVEAAQAYFSKQLNYVNKALSASPRYVMGENFNTADILLTTCLTTAIRNNISLPNICIEYLDRTTARPAYRAAYAANHPQT
jgi:glutathione S-transferase